MLIIGMTGVQLGDHILQIGCTSGGALAAVAGKVGLSGRMLAVVPDDAAAVRARKGARQQGVLVEVEVSRSSHLPADDASFDLVVVDDARGDFAGMPPAEQTERLRDAFRVLRPGGRCLVISGMPGGGLSTLVGGASRGPEFDATGALESGGFRFVRLLAEREGLRFREGMKPRLATAG